MITRQQQILLKRAQSEAALDDADYREAIKQVSGIDGCRSSKDPRLGDDHVDALLSYFEAIFWRKVDLGQLQAPCKPDAIFQKRRYWTTKNTRSENSRDRYAAGAVHQEIAMLEAELRKLGFGSNYFAAIRAKVSPSQDFRGLHLYKAALRRTFAAKKKQFPDTRSAVKNRTQACA